VKAIQIHHPAGLDNLKLGDVADAAAPGPGQIMVRLRASSLNFHDYAVVIGMIPTPELRIPMSDGAGEVVAVGEGVTGYKVGDAVVTTFFPRMAGWPPARRRLHPGAGRRD
jgi:NADPH:quinone reductase-like Zn-dependent oxidoreductase